MSSAEIIRMLSIDDKTVTTELDRAGYRKMGVVVKAAASFDEARKIVAGEPIDLIVINLDYAKVDALQATKHFKGTEVTKQIPVVLTSVRTAAKVRNSALEAGADLFVEQPLPRQYFIEKLKQLLEQRTRTTERVEGDGEVRFNFAGEDRSCPIGDLSISGILLTTELALPDGTALEVEFDIPGGKKPIRVKGEVVRTIRYTNKTPEQATGVGVRFTEFNGDSEKRLEKYITKAAHSDSKMQYYL